MIFKDFIGNELQIGSFCAYPGAGNTKAEYGMILYKVLGFDEAKKKVKVARIDTHMAQGALYDSFHPSHLKNAMESTTSVPDFYNRNGGNDITAKIAVQVINSSIENTNKLAVVDPSERVKVVFNMILEGDSSVFDIVTAREIMYWIHGSTHTQNPF